MGLAMQLMWPVALQLVLSELPLGTHYLYQPQRNGQLSWLLASVLWRQRWDLNPPGVDATKFKTLHLNPQGGHL